MDVWSYDFEVFNGDIPTNREYYEKLNERLRTVGLPELIISGNAVYKDFSLIFLLI